ncbi:murein transglycosylase A [Geothermobacter ehrlichii]|uniref:murein transglycosylase A n=1 Tax=Geothermobacter ehrlichii TaxID=213224 RepID=UPI001FE25897|nr:MltA domain-containing protein [Geothermobacter ehrlichii]
MKKGLLLFLVTVFALAACARAPEKRLEKAPPAVAAPAAVPADWRELPDWEEDDPRPVLAAFVEACRALRWRPGWRNSCEAAGNWPAATAEEARRFFVGYFRPWRLQQEDGSPEGLLTGYYVPELAGSPTPDRRFRYPVYGVPDDLLVIDLASVYPELARYRLRGRLDGRRVVPYWSRAEIDARPELLAGHELFWVEDPVGLFFLQIQGSGRIRLPDGERVLVNYADQNGHPYRSIGRLLLQRGEMTPDQMSMQNIRFWARRHPDRVAELLAENPSYIFFRRLGSEWLTPPGAMGLALVPERSLAVDPRYVPLGAPVFLDTTWPVGQAPLRRLMLALDTGGAIRGRVRADFFWGLGDEAGALAGRMKQPARLWLLLPADVRPPSFSGGE